MSILLQELKLEDNCPFPDFVKALKDTDEEYNKSTTLLGQILHKTHKISPKEGDVSDSN